MHNRSWLSYALITTAFWGVWGAFTGYPAEHGFPETLTYCVWALTMIPPALYALARSGWRFECSARAVWLGGLVGFLGAGGQMILFHAVRSGPTYLIFPLIALSPALTIALSFIFLRERATRRGTLGIVLALAALPLFDYGTGGSGAQAGWWLIEALLVLVAWGLQAYIIKFATRTLSAESIFVYMTITGLLLIPAALALTDFSQPINYGWQGPYLAATIQILNAIGALTLVYAFRYGRALVVSPLANAGAPLITAVIALLILGSVPPTSKLIGVALAFVAALLLALEPEEKPAAAAAVASGRGDLAS